MSDFDYGSDGGFSYGDSEAYNDMEADDDGQDFGFDAAPSSPVGQLRKSKFQILRHSELAERQSRAVKATADLLCVPPTEATRVLRHYKWDAARLQEEWFSDPEAVRKTVGLVDEVPSTRRKEEKCSICFETFPLTDMQAARCKHYFCKDCWRGYAQTSIESGPSCLDLRCPIPDCSAVVPTALVLDVCDATHVDRYKEFSIDSFVDDNNQLAWCTAPGCTNAAEALVDAPREPLDIFCSCGNAFCFTCKEEAHRPVDCETVHRWMLKNSAESENMTWILANTKPCPKCSRPIEKNQGCMHMSCSQCRHEFCWLCLGPWSEHGERTGGYYSCNTYKRKKEAGNEDPVEQQRAHARASLERYMHYWQRWAEHDKARRSATKSLKSWETDNLAKLEIRTATPSSQLRFILDAWREVLSCRRVLKWTYAVGYYWFDDPAAGTSAADRERLVTHREFFEFTQQEAEQSLERITHQVEHRLPAFLGEVLSSFDTEPLDSAAWAKFREELIGLTDVTRSQFAKLVDFLEKGLEEGLTEFARGGDETARELAAAKAAAAAAEATDAAAAGPSSAGGASASGSGAGPSRTRNDNHHGDAAAGNDDESGGGAGGFLRRSMRNATRRFHTTDPFVCPHCTYTNERGGTSCEMCTKPRAN